VGRCVCFEILCMEGRESSMGMPPPSGQSGGNNSNINNNNSNSAMTVSTGLHTPSSAPATVAGRPANNNINNVNNSSSNPNAVNSSAVQTPPNMTANRSLAITMAMGGTDSMKRKRGRPRKYGPDGSMALALAPLSASAPGAPFSPLQKRGRGRPPGSGKKQRLAALGEWVVGSAGIGFTPHVITIAAGEDVASKIMSFSQQGPRAVCILSANGAISNVTLRQPATSGGTLTYEGRFEILSLSGSFMLTENGGARSRTGGLSVSLASPDGRVVGGGVAGMLMAASPVQVVVGSFISNGQKDPPKPANPEPSIGLAQAAASGGPVAIPISRSPLNDTYGGPGSPPLNQNTGGSAISNTNQQAIHNMTSFQSMAWTGSQSMKEARHNTDINISLPGG